MIKQISPTNPLGDSEELVLSQYQGGTSPASDQKSFLKSQEP